MSESFTFHFVKKELPILRQKSFGDMINHLKNGSSLSRYHFMEWYLVNEEDLINSISENDVQLYINSMNKRQWKKALLEYIIPHLLFSEIDAMALHRTVAKLHKVYGAKFEGFLEETRKFESYIWFTRLTAPSVTAQIEKELLISKAELLKLEKKGPDFEKEFKKKQTRHHKLNSYFEINNEWFKLNKIPTSKELITLAKLLENCDGIDDIAELIKKWIQVLPDSKKLPFVEKLTSIESFHEECSWFVSLLALNRITPWEQSVQYTEHFNSNLTEKIEHFQGLFIEYNLYHTRFGSGMVENHYEESFIKYFSDDTSILSFILKIKSNTQRSKLFLSLLNHNPNLVGTILQNKKMLQNEFYSLLKMIKNDVDSFAAFYTLSSDTITRGFLLEYIDEFIITKGQTEWLVFLDPKRIERLLARKQGEGLVERWTESLTAVLNQKWTDTANPIIESAYCRYWEYLFETNYRFRMGLLTDISYLEYYLYHNGSNKLVFDWFKDEENESKLVLCLKDAHFTELTVPVIRSILPEEKRNEIALQLIDSPEYHPFLDCLDYRVIGTEKNEDQTIPHRFILKHSNYFEFEGDDLPAEFESCRFKLSRYGLLKKPDMVLRRAVIIPEIDEQDLDIDQFLDDLSNI